MPKLNSPQRTFSPLDQRYQEAFLRAVAEQEEQRRLPLGIGPLGMRPTMNALETRDNMARMAELYMQQQFPGYAGAGGVNIGKNIYAPRFRSGRGGSHGYAGGEEAPYIPRVVAVGAAPQPAIYPGRANPGLITSTPPAFTGPKTVEEVQADQYAAREAAGVTNEAAPTGQIPLKSGFMWIGGPEGQSVYDEWLAES